VCFLSYPTPPEINIYGAPDLSYKIVDIGELLALHNRDYFQPSYLEYQIISSTFFEPIWPPIK
jgi:hypothetical protein